MKASEFLSHTAKIKAEGTRNFINFPLSYFEKLEMMENYRSEIEKISAVFPDVDFDVYYNEFRDAYELLADFNIRGAEHWYVINAEKKIGVNGLFWLQENLDDADGTIIDIVGNASVRKLVLALKKLRKSA